MPDVSKAVSMDAKSPGNRIYVVGNTYAELGGSHYYAIHGFIGNSAPKVRPAEGKRTMEALSLAVDQGLVRSCHDCSEGGVGVAAAEMAFAGGLGMHLSLTDLPRDANVTTDDVSFSRSLTADSSWRLSPEKQEAFEKCMTGVLIGCIGTVVDSRDFVVNSTDGSTIVRTTIDRLKESCRGRFGGDV